MTFAWVSCEKSGALLLLVGCCPSSGCWADSSGTIDLFSKPRAITRIPSSHPDRSHPYGLGDSLVSCSLPVGLFRVLLIVEWAAAAHYRNGQEIVFLGWRRGIPFQRECIPGIIS